MPHYRFRLHIPAVLLMLLGCSHAPKVQSQSQLEDAIIIGDLYQVKKLLANGSSVQEHYRGGMKPVHYAVAHADILEYLVSKGADVNSRTDTLETPLHVAATNGREEAVKWLVAHGANVDAQDSQGRTPLYLAISTSRLKYARKAELQCARALMLGGADPSIKDKHGSSALSLATEVHDGEASSLLKAK